MDRLSFFLLSVTLPSSTFRFTGAAVIWVRAAEGEDCTLPCFRNTTLELSVLLWSCSDQDKDLLVFREALQEGYEDLCYRNRVKLLDPQLQTELSVVLKNVTEKDSGTYRCEAEYDDGRVISQFINLTVTEPETIKAEARTEIKTETNTEIKTETNTEIKTETNTEPSLGLILGPVFGLFALILVIIVLWVLFKKRIKDKPFFSNESSCFQKLKKLFTTCLNDSSSSSASSTSSNGSDELLIKEHPSSRDTEQNTLKPSVFSESCPPC